MRSLWRWHVAVSSWRVPGCRYVIVWPIALAFYDGRRCLAAWCELREGFRVFRADRIDALTVSEQRYPQRRAVLYKAWQQERRLAYIQPEPVPAASDESPADC